MRQYRPRIVDNMIKELFSELPAIALDGAKAVGKTSTASQLANQTIRLDVRESVELMGNGLEVLEKAAKPLLLDEWQRYPKTWDFVRRAVDDDTTPGQFLLTGSAEPRNANIHSGAGRIVRIRMRPLSLQERGLETTTISLDALLAGSLQTVTGTSSLTLSDYLHEIVSSGFPGFRGLSQKALQVQLDSYLENLVSKEFPDQGQFVRKPSALKGWLRAYAAATASTASYQTILSAATPGEAKKPAKGTTQTYRDVLDGLWITDRVEAWLPTINTFTALGKSPKHFLVDPALSARLLSVTEEQLLQGTERRVLGPQHGSLAGRLFEALNALCLQTYAQVNSASLRHFRSSKGDHEVDFIVERDYSIVAIEVKMSPDITDKDVRELNWLEDQYPDYRISKLVLNTGQLAYTRHDGIHIVPASLLGA